MNRSWWVAMWLALAFGPDGARGQELADAPDPERPDGGEAPSFYTAGVEALVALKATDLESAIDELPPLDRAVLALYRIGGLSYAQLSYVLGVSRREGRACLYRATERLKSELFATIFGRS